jgi:hypothetical protein
MPFGDTLLLHFIYGKILVWTRDQTPLCGHNQRNEREEREERREKREKIEKVKKERKKLCM